MSVPNALGDTSSYFAMTAMLAIMVGVLLLGAGPDAAGLPGRVLAKPVITGCIVGLANSEARRHDPA